MRSMIRKLTLLAAALMIMAVPAGAEEGSRLMEQGQQVEKKECLIVAMNCAGPIDTTQERIDRLRGEISRGTDAYTADELRVLERRLEDATRSLENMGVGADAS